MTQHHEGCESEGLYRKYEVRRLDDQTGVHRDCRYFVLDLTHDPAARHAALDYAEQIEATRPTLASDLREAVAGSATPTTELRRAAQAVLDEYEVHDWFPDDHPLVQLASAVAGSATPTGDNE